MLAGPANHSPGESRRSEKHDVQTDPVIDDGPEASPMSPMAVAMRSSGYSVVIEVLPGALEGFHTRGNGHASGRRPGCSSRSAGSRTVFAFSRWWEPQIGIGDHEQRGDQHRLHDEHPAEASFCAAAPIGKPRPRPANVSQSSQPGGSEHEHDLTSLMPTARASGSNFVDAPAAMARLNSNARHHDGCLPTTLRPAPKAPQKR